jgi:hypothetical protein
MRCAGLAERIGEINNAYKILIGNLKDYLEDLSLSRRMTLKHIRRK